MRALQGTDGDSTQQQIVSAISAASPTDLAGIPVKSYANGQTAFVTTPARPGGAQFFILSPATAGAANADNVIATADDSSRQWIEADLFGGIRVCMTPIMDLTATGSTLILPAIKGYYPSVYGERVILTTTTGALSTSPTRSIGNNVNQDNMLAAAAITSFATAFSTGAPSVSVGSTSILSTSAKALDMDGAPLYLKVTIGATGTGGFVLRGRYIYFCAYVPV
jgi:hypothetical protein